MRGIEQRLERLEETLGNNRCVCGDRSSARLELVVVEEGWDEERIRLEEASRQIVCPIHGRWTPPILRLSPTDVRL